MRLLRSSYIIPALEKTLSDATLVGGALKYFFANPDNKRKDLRFSAHQLKGFATLKSSRGSARYLSKFAP